MMQERMIKTVKETLATAVGKMGLIYNTWNPCQMIIRLMTHHHVKKYSKLDAK